MGGKFDRCLRGKHEFPSWGPAPIVLDEFYRWRCSECGAWMHRSELDGYAVERMREVKRKNLVPFEKSKEQDQAARRALLALKAEAGGVRLAYADPLASTPASRRSPGVDSPRSRGVHSGGSSPRPRKAVRS